MPGQDSKSDAGALGFRFDGEGGDAVVKNLGAACLDIDRRQTTQVGVNGRDQGKRALLGTAIPIPPGERHGAGDPVGGFRWRSCWGG